MIRNRRPTVRSCALAVLVGLSSAIGGGTASAAFVDTNAPGYLPISGAWTETAGEGLTGTSDPNANAMAMTTSLTGSKFILAADVTVDAATPYGVASLAFRAAEDGGEGYLVSLDPNLDRLRLFDAATGNDIGSAYQAPLDAGATYRLSVEADGSSIRVALDGAEAIVASDSTYAHGRSGFHVYNGSASFQRVRSHEVSTNLSGWTTSGGTWSIASDGWRATASSGQNSLATADVAADDFTYEAEMMLHDPYAVGTLLFRTNVAGSAGYALQADPNLDRIRLYRIDGDATLATADVPVETGTLYRVRVRASGDELRVHWQSSFLPPTNGYDPILTATDASHGGGRVGLSVYNGSATFQHVRISDLNTNLHGWNAVGGSWTPHIDGVKASSVDASDTYRLAEGTYESFVMEGDLTVDSGTPFGTAALVFRANDTGTAGYVVNIDPNADVVRLFLAGSGTTIASASRSIEAGVRYRLEAVVDGPRIRVFFDGEAAPVIDVANASYAAGKVGLNAYNGAAYFQNVFVTKLDEYYAELYRPQYHFTQARTPVADPNGLVYYEGEYHLFHQGDGRWQHAVSADLLHWKHLPIAIPWHDMGQAWSGAAVVDASDASGLFDGGSGLVAYYTSYHPDRPNGNQKIGLAYSRDRGRTWELYDGNPVVENPGGPQGDWDFRDPKVVWDADRSQWVMVVSGGDHIRFYTSTNLLHWSYASAFGYGDYVHGGVWECPDLFQLPVDGNDADRRWVLMISTGAVTQTDGSAMEYFVGDFDGTTFASDHPPSATLRVDWGKDMYAAMSFSDIPAADGRRISLGWMSNWDYPFSAPTAPWKGQMSVPRSLTLETVPGQGIRLIQRPIAELEALRGAGGSWNDLTVTPTSPDVLADWSGTAYEIVGEFEIPAAGGASEFGFRLREGGEQRTFVGYKPGEGILFVNRTESGSDDFTERFTGWRQAPLEPENGRIRMRVFVDESSIELFGGGGKVVFSELIFPDAARDGMSFYAMGGDVRIVSLQVYPLGNTWRNEPPAGSSPEKVVMDRSRLELSAGETHRLFANVLPRTATDRSLIWTSSNPSVAAVAAVDANSANITAVGRGLAAVRATTASGAVVGSTVVAVGAPFRTNLTGWRATPGGVWRETADGMTGSFDKDSNYMSDITADHFTYEADVRMDPAGGAGSIIFRADATGASGYYVNIDPNLRKLRLFYKINGSFSNGQVLAEVPMFLQTSKTYRIRIVAEGTNLKVYVNGAAAPVIDVNDATFGAGYFGLNAFGGRASYQNVYWRALLEDGAAYRIMNANADKALDASGSSNGSNVQLWTYLGYPNQEWTLSAESDGTYALTERSAGKALDAAGEADGSNVQVWAYGGHANQRWTIVPNDDGTYSLFDARSGKALDAANAGTTDGTNVQLNGGNGTAAQKWRFFKGTP
ncbi:GH32 C-terminal domain-containing protein [Paenibacillus sp.]|uniref:GH32 C-terminal domain-containing protein n=1 Tax=Paenibacillus sp. TaxID=58172 RepID=UPI002810EDC8|nr:GH32 C-terminal domain-containing protein [Paenibacillus sp.]